MDPVTAPCPCCGSPPATWRRSVKRKLPEPSADVAARVEVESEVAALRDTLSSQQQTIEELCAELEQERSAASSAASEAMSMILRLQHEKAEAQMESRQFKRFADERMAHDQQELAELDDLLFKREEAIESLSCEIRAYKHRLASYGIEDGVPLPPLPVPAAEFDPNEFEYPPLRCTVRGDYYEDENAGLDKIRNLESQIYELEMGPGSSSQANDKALDESDDGSATVCTVNEVHASSAGASGEDEDGDKVVVVGNGEEENGDINKLYKRLQALEADRESMRQAIISMRMEKAQLVLLREIAQQLCKEAAPERRVFMKTSTSFLAAFSIVAVIKWVMSFVFWRKNASRTKYSCGLSKNNVGLLVLLDKSPHVNQLTRLKTSQS